MGDSWAFFSWIDDSYNENLKRFGFTDVLAESNGDMSVNGTHASSYFNDLTRKNAVKSFIQNNSDLEFVHFSLGGNDILGDWNNSMTSFQEDSMLQVLMKDIKKGIDTVLSFNPNLEILFAGYDFPNFAETVSTLPTSPINLQELHPFYNLWVDMGKATPTEINALEIKATQLFIDSANAWDHVSFVNNLGLMQWHYGQVDALQVAPFGTYAPYTAPVPGGFPDYPSPLAALNFDGLDAFHLNDNAFERFIERHFQEFYWERLRNADTTIYTSGINYNGSVNQNNVTDTFKIGNISSDDNKIILSFNTSKLKKMQLKTASIFLQRENLIGDNLKNEDLTLEIKQGNFGANLTLEIEDYNNSADSSMIACTFGTVAKNDFWYRIDIPKELQKFINYNGYTQFRLSYQIDDTDRNFSFKNNSNKVFLDIEYGTETIVVDTLLSINDMENKSINLYPNPTNKFLKFETESKINQLIILDSRGNKIRSFNNPQQKIDIRFLEKGFYFVEVKTFNKNTVYKFIKE